MLDEQPLEVRLTNGRIKIQAGQAEEPRAVVTTDTFTLFSLNNGRMSLTDAAADRKITAEGDRTTVTALAKAFAL